jgi:hypothetical protein
MTAKLKPHPYAATYPPMHPEEFEALVEDIKVRGLKRDILLFEGMILDGRNRYEACLKAGVEPHFVEYEGEDALAEVNSLNQYRQMTPGQRALVAARQWMIGDTHQMGRRNGTDSLNSAGQRDLAKRFRCSPGSIRQARDLIEKAEDLEAKVDGGMVLAEAYHEWQEREKAKEQRNQDMACLGEYRERVEAGRMKFEEAMRRVDEERRKALEKRKNDEDSRRQWLHDFEEALWFFEDRVDNYRDQQIAWFTQEGEPGTDEHEITPERIDKAINGLRRAQQLAFGDNNGSQQGSRRGRKKSARSH